VVERTEPGWIERPEWQRTTIGECEEAVKLSFGREVLDLCCGTGWCTQRISEVAKSVTGVDNDKDAIEFAEIKYGGKFLVMDALDLKFHNDTFDTVILREAIEHFSGQETHKLFEEITRVLKPNGLLFGTTSVVATKSDAERVMRNNPYHKKIFASGEMRDILDSFFEKYEVRFEATTSLRIQFKAWFKRQQRFRNGN